MLLYIGTKDEVWRMNRIWDVDNLEKTITDLDLLSCMVIHDQDGLDEVISSIHLSFYMSYMVV